MYDLARTSYSSWQMILAGWMSPFMVVMGQRLISTVWRRESWNWPSTTLPRSVVRPGPGRCWGRFGVTTPNNKLALPMDTVTLGDALKSKGYDTSLGGKWHLGSMPKWGPNHFGFDHTYGSLAGGISPWSHRYKTVIRKVRTQSPGIATKNLSMNRAT